MSSPKKTDNQLLFHVLDDIHDALLTIKDILNELDDRDRCRYWCHDRGNHHIQCTYNKG